MSAITHILTQGTKEWLSYRQAYFNASEAAAMLNLSAHTSRDALLEEKATGNKPKVDAATQAIFDEGHRLELQARPSAEEMIGEDLFSPTMSKEIEGLNLSASFDGLTMLDDVVWEHKTLNKTLKLNLSKNIIPEAYKPQLEQQLMICGAEKCLFMASNDDDKMHVWYESEPLLRKRIIKGWQQFAEDLRCWKKTEVVVEPIAKKVEALPALNVEIEGGITASNFDSYETNALHFIDNINTDLQTDSDFANADAIVKFCSKTEKELKLVKQAALEQTSDIAALFKKIDYLTNEMRDKRLSLDKMVKVRKASIKLEIVNEAKAEFIAHVEKLNQRLPEIAPFFIALDSFETAVKNKRTVESLRNAVNTELANLKISINEHADMCENNIKALQEIAGDYGFLFRDLKDIVTKSREDLINLAKARIAEHEAAEAKRLEAERERIRQEEQAKAEAKPVKKETATTLENTEKSAEAPQVFDKPDYAYFTKALNQLVRDIETHSKYELRRALQRLADAV